MEHWTNHGDDRIHHMMKDAFSSRSKLYQEHADKKRHYLARSNYKHSWEYDSHPTRRYEDDDERYRRPAFPDDKKNYD